MVECYVVSFLEGMYVNYVGVFVSVFLNGFLVGIGFGLLFIGKQGDVLIFVIIIDCGLNVDLLKEGKNEIKIFVMLDFVLLLMMICV